jgi:hypothetical protein
MRSIAQPDRAGFDETTELLIRVFALDIFRGTAHSRANPNHNSPYENHIQNPGRFHHEPCLSPA